MTQGQSQVTLLKVAKFAKICRTTPRTIRFYEKKGLIKPVFIDEFSGYRFYDPKQAREVFKVKLFQNFDMSLSDISKNIKKYKEYSFLEKKLNDIKQEIEEKQREYSFMKNINNFLFGSKKLENFLKIKNIGPFVLLTRLIKHGRYDQIDSYAESLKKLAKKLKIKTTDKYIALYLEPEKYGPNDIALEVGLICVKKPKVKLPLNCYFKTLPKQKSVVFDYKGPFQYLTFIHQKLFYSDYFRKLKLKNFPFDLYIRSFMNTKSPYDYLTRVVYPID